MLAGEERLVGNGQIRNVYFVEYEGRVVVAKTLREGHTLFSQKNHMIMHRAEMISLDAVSSRRGDFQHSSMTEKMTALHEVRQLPLLQLVVADISRWFRHNVRVSLSTDC